MEEIIKRAYIESLENRREGDKKEEVEAIKKKIREAKKIVVATNNEKKFKVIRDIILKVSNAEIKMIDLDTKIADLTRMPAITKALMALDVEDADICIARGRLGVPGSGSMLVILDNKGRILTAALSESSVIHKEDLEERIKKELIYALKRVGL
ncbi:FeGP cofactor biosynthesis guanylyltransferase HcgB family protein [Methanocaldococcus sp.]